MGRGFVMRLKNKVTLITGAASGIGKKTAEVFLEEGAVVLLADVSEEKGKEALVELRKKGSQIYFYPLHVRDESGWENLLANIMNEWSQLDVLVNNAGISLTGSVEECALEDWRYVHEINLDGVFLGTKHAIRVMKKSTSGSIVNICSIEGNVAEAHLAAYNSSKGGVKLLTKSAALHCAQENYQIRVNSVHPGYLHTPMHDRFSAEKIKEIAARHPIGFLGSPLDVAYGILYLASEESRFVTGSELMIDGGYTAQ